MLSSRLLIVELIQPAVHFTNRCSFFPVVLILQVISPHCPMTKSVRSTLNPQGHIRAEELSGIELERKSNKGKIFYCRLKIIHEIYLFLDFLKNWLAKTKYINKSRISSGKKVKIYSTIICSRPFVSGF